MKGFDRFPIRRLIGIVVLAFAIALPAATPASAQYYGYPYSGYSSTCYPYSGIGYGIYDPYRTPCTPYGYSVTGSSISTPYYGYPYSGYGYSGYPYAGNGYSSYYGSPYSSYYGSSSAYNPYSAYYASYYASYLGAYYGSYYGSMGGYGMYPYGMYY